MRKTKIVRASSPRTWPNMREAVTECKVAKLSFLDDGSPSAFQADELRVLKVFEKPTEMYHKEMVNSPPCTW